MRVRLRFLTLIAISVAGIFYISENKPSARSVTFNEVAPIFFKNCAGCHRPDDIAPFSILSYKDARPWAKSIKEQVIRREMPPWHADPHFGQFENNARLTQAEIDTIVAWVDGGALEGDPKGLPVAPDPKNDWEIGNPDVVLTMPEEASIAARGADDYFYFRVPTGFNEDKWIQAVEFRPGNRRVVHHALVFVETPALFQKAQDLARKTGKALIDPISIFQGSITETSRLEGTVVRTRPDAPVINDLCAAGIENPSRGGTSLLSVYAPGRQADVYPIGMAKRLPAGSNLIFQMHYSSETGKVEKDRTSVGLTFARHPVEREVETIFVSNNLLAIPPGAENHQANACATIPRDVQFINYMPHMHTRGKDMRYEIVYPDGRRETLLYVDRYHYKWQRLYKLKTPLSIPKGSRLIVTAHFDNSVRNKYNPDPTKMVRFGQPTYDEMLSGLLNYAVDLPKDRLTTETGEAKQP